MMLLMRYLPWLIGAFALFGTGVWTGNALNPWHGRYQSLQVSDAQQRADGEEAVRKVLSAQLAEAQAVSSNNADSMVRLANENATLAADRDSNLALARRLLNAQARSASQDRGMSTSTSGPDPPGARDPGPPTKAEGLLVDVADGYERCVNQLNALIAEVKPQL
jgi:hypothetical protein